jgi:hypothetical protein
MAVVSFTLLILVQLRNFGPRRPDAASADIAKKSDSLRAGSGMDHKSYVAEFQREANNGGTPI